MATKKISSAQYASDLFLQLEAEGWASFPNPSAPYWKCLSRKTDPQGITFSIGCDDGPTGRLRVHLFSGEPMHKLATFRQRTPIMAVAAAINAIYHQLQP